MDSQVPPADLSRLMRGDASYDARTVMHILAAVRKHLDMDVAFVSRFRERDRVLEHVDTDTVGMPIHAGQVILLENGYCKKVVTGELPELIPDTRCEPIAMAIPDTAAIPIGKHLSVPIRLSDGRIYGTFCCFGYRNDPTLTERDLNFMRAFADMVAHDLEARLNAQRHRSRTQERISRALAEGQPQIVFQPILDIRSGGIEGYECLSRFKPVTPSGRPGGEYRPPDEWFREASTVGLGADLEIAAIRQALAHLPAFDAPTYLSVNCSAGTILTGRLPDVFNGHDGRRIVVEITEHDSIDDYPSLLQALAPLRARGILIAIDDTGAGYASLRHVLQLDPDKVKLDVSITRGVDVDVKHRALVAALVAFTRQTGASMVAEGVETASERDTLVALGIDAMQGYLIGRPSPAPSVAHRPAPPHASPMTPSDAQGATRMPAADAISRVS